MLPEVKEQIIAAAKQYMAETELSQNELATVSKVPASYLSNMMRGLLSIRIGDKDVAIADSYYRKLAKCIGYDLKAVVWEALPTPQFTEIIAALTESREQGSSGMLICETGSGKTFATDKYCQRNPRYVWKITTSEDYSPSVIIDKLIELMELGGKGRNADKIDRIGTYLDKLKANEERPQIIVDEGENMRAPHFRKMKALFDRVSKSASIMIIATEQLPKKLETLKAKDKDGIPQFCRRFKAGTRHISPIDTSFSMFFEKHVQDMGLRRLLRQECENYGELSDYLLPVMRDCHEHNKKLTEANFRLYWGNKF